MIFTEVEFGKLIPRCWLLKFVILEFAPAAWFKHIEYLYRKKKKKKKQKKTDIVNNNCINIKLITVRTKNLLGLDFLLIHQK